MIIPLVKKKIPLLLLAAILVFTGGLALSFAGAQKASAEMDAASQIVLNPSRPAALAAAVTDDSSVFLLTAEIPEKPAGPMDKQKAEWQNREQEGPPPWSAARIKDTEGNWFNGDRTGPPPWAGPSDQEKAEWQDSEQEGPPPWSAARIKDTEGNWFNGDRTGPPPWAGPNDQEKAEWQDSEQEGPPPWAGPKRNKAS